MENHYPVHEIDVKFPTDPLDCDVGRELTADMRTERAIVAGLLHHLVQYGIGPRDIPACADQRSTPERCVMESLFQGLTGEVELVVEGDQWIPPRGPLVPATGTILLELGAGVNVVKSWSSSPRKFLEFSKAMLDFNPRDFYDVGEALPAQAAEHVTCADAALPATVHAIIQALNDSASTEGCPEGRALVDAATLRSLVLAAGVSSDTAEPAAAPDATANEDAPTPELEQLSPLSPRMRKLRAIQEKILALSDRPPMEHVAVRHACGGFVMVTRPVAGK